MLDPATAYQELLHRVRRLGNHWKRIRFVNGFLRWIAQSGAVLAILLVLDILLPIRGLPWILTILLSLGIVLWWGYRYVVKTLLADVSAPRVAAHVEQTYPGSENRILSAIELWPEEPRAQYGYSRDFVHQLLLQAHELSGKLDPRIVFATERKYLVHHMRWMLGTVLLCAGLLIVFPDSGKHLIRGFSEFRNIPAQVTSAQIVQVIPGDVEISLNESVTIQAEVAGRIEPPVQTRVTWNATPDSGADSRSMSYDMRAVSSGVYEVTLHNIANPLTYQVSIGDTRSEFYRITLRRPPMLQELQLTLHPPEYTQLAPQALEPGTGNVTSLAGTRVELRVQSTNPLAHATIEFASDKIQPLTIEEHRVRGDFVVESNDSYVIRITDARGLVNPEPIRYTITAIEDEHPQVDILDPGRDVVLDDNMMVYLNALAQDDYGITRAELVYTHEETGAVQRVPLDSETAGAVVSYRYDWDIDALNLFPEDVLSYYVEVWDNDTIHGPKSGRSPSYRIRHPSLAEIYSRMETQQVGEQSAMEELLDEQQEAHTTIDDIIDELRKTQELTWKEQKTVEQVIQTQEQIRKKAQELVQQLQQTAEEMQQKQLFDDQTIEKYRELQKLMDKALTEDQKQILQKLREALEKQQISQQERDLLEANFKQEEFQQRLERLIELYKQMLTQQKLEAAAKQAKELYERQKATSEQIREQAKSDGSPNAEESRKEMGESARREEKLSEQLGELEQELEAIADEMRAFPNYERVAEEVSRLKQESQDRQTTQRLKQAGQKLRQKRSKEAASDAQNAMNAMNDLQQGLDNAVEFMRGANAEEALAEMQNAVREGLLLSKEHEQALDQTKDLVRVSRGDYLEGELRRIQNLASKQLSIAQGLGILGDRLWNLGKEQMQIEPRIVWTLRAAQDELARASRALEDRKPNSAIPMQYQALADINQAVRDLLDAMDQMNQQMSMGGLESMLEQLEQLAGNQSQLNEMAQQLGEQMRREGNVPGAEQMMKRMAFEQSLIREATERLAESMEKFNQALGNLQDVAEEMKEVEAELQEGKLDEQLLQKQRQILTRMLESSKSLQKRQTSKERKSETAQDTGQNRDASPLDPELLKIRQQLEERVRSGAAEQWPDAYRELIRKYYRALSQQVR